MAVEYFPATLQNLADQFGRLPGIGNKTAQRLAFHLLGLPKEEVEAFAEAMLEAKRKIHCCPVCTSQVCSMGFSYFSIKS